MRTHVTLAVLAATGLLAAGCSSAGNAAPQDPPSAHSTAGLRAASLPWDRPANQQARVKAAGLSLTPEETLAVHYHAHLDVFVNGQPVPVPAGLGINAGPNGELPEHGAPGIAPLHTHDPSGIVHIEAPSDMTFTLGQVFDEWGILLTGSQAGAYSPVKVYVDGKAHHGNPDAIVLKSHEEIAVVAGKGDVQVPSSYDFPPGD
jgi:hypothetical protein